jgi:site-specific DNA-methyltransferase (adenine-specific)
MIDLRLGDCLEIMPTLEAGSVDAVITDPPYNSKLAYATYVDDMPADEYWDWLGEVVRECCRVSRGIVLIKHSSLKICEWAQKFGKTRMIVWYKPFSSGFPMNGFATHFEPIWVAQGKTIKWAKDVFEVNSGAGNREKSWGHPAQMPELLARKLIDVCVESNGIVLDPFMGSGTTGVACVKTGRNFIGVELDEGYFKIAQRRIEEAQMQLPLLELG